ncbi:MAG: ion channel protein [Candidatus Binatia bacterium]|nr:MAG: ion channel protein [Candidatus Binatia bacterium]
MNRFDFTLLRWATTYANVWPWFDGFVAFLVSWEIAKGGFVIALYWWAWFRLDKAQGKGADKVQESQRARLLLALAGAMTGLTIAAVAALVLPYRPRPRILVGLDPELSPGWAEWSAFPSDHATLFFALALGLWYVHRRLGWVALLHAIVVVSLPRVYLGLHYPTDILGGALIGWCVAWFAQRERRLLVLAQRLVHWGSVRPAWFYALGFVASYSVATLFSDWRRAGNTLLAWLLR